ncbi:MAG: RND family transporter [Mycolicibacter algericus]|uniref:MMPL/RND family transporter n=1 Tax=Mycolicibacter algericus TaxID=1288388 RepID=UPI003C749E95
MTVASADQPGGSQPLAARMIRRFALVIVLIWLAVTVVLSGSVPPLEQVESEHSLSLSPVDAPSFKAMKLMGELFQEANSESVAVILLEGEEPLGVDAHRFYDSIISRLKADPDRVEHIQDFWGDPLTAGGAQSGDGKAAYVMLNLRGNIGTAQANDAVQMVQDVVSGTPPPPGVTAYVTGPAPIVADMSKSGNKTVLLVTTVTFAVIFIMLLIVYRSVVSVIVLLLLVGIQLQVAKGIVAFLGEQGIVGLTTYVVNLLVSVGIAASTDYGIFFTGRYQEARLAGEDRESAYYTAYRGVAKVVLASGLTIAGAIFCLHFTRLPYFQPLGVPGAIGILVAVAVALTLIPAVMVVGGRFGLFEPKRKIITKTWRRVGTAVVRWPAPILAAAIAAALVGLLTLAGYNPSYSDQKFIPKSIPSIEGLTALERHFPTSRMSTPNILLIESDHDMRNSTDFLVLNKVAKGVFAIPGVASVQSVTRPEGTPLNHTSIPSMLSVSSASQRLGLPFQQANMQDMLKQADDMGEAINTMQRMYGLMKQMADATHSTVGTAHEMKEVTDRLRDNVADVEDFWRPIRTYFYWEPHCYDIPVCFAIRSMFDVMDGVDQISEKLTDLITDMDQLDLLMPQMLAQFPLMIETMRSSRTMILSMYSTMSGVLGQMEDSTDNATAMGKAFDAANSDDSFYLPPEVLKNKDFQRVMDIFMSPDGKAARMMISQRGDPLTPEGMALVEPIKAAAEEALKGTPLESAQVYLAGAAATARDLVIGSNYDLLIAGLSALCLIFVVMMIFTRSLVAALVIVGTVVISMGAAFGLSVLVWQHLVGVQMNWVVLAMSVIVMLAVGSDYNLMLVARMKEEIGAGINTGIIRAMAGTGKVVTTAGLVFAFTMASMVVSDLLSISQVGTTIGMGLLFDTLIVRTFMTPTVAALLGRWFWWPQKVRPRPASTMLRSVGPRPLVRAIFLRD